MFTGFFEDTVVFHTKCATFWLNPEIGFEDVLEYQKKTWLIFPAQVKTQNGFSALPHLL
jgi:hypothetical protein